MQKFANLFVNIATRKQPLQFERTYGITCMTCKSLGMFDKKFAFHPCGHVIHAQCLQGHVNSGNCINTKCPTCQAEIEGIENITKIPALKKKRTQFKKLIIENRKKRKRALRQAQDDRQEGEPSAKRRKLN